MGLKDALSGLADMYKSEVEKKDSAQYADALKVCSESFFNHLANSTHGIGAHVKDVEYTDGYFVFGRGTNSVVHFHIDECPEWKFGIWWNVPEEPEKTTFKGEFFCQYESTIDKFKPSRSVMREAITINLSGIGDDVWNAVRMVDFIANEPYLAFCRDLCYWNYNYEYHTREEAKAVYDEFVRRKAIEQRLTGMLDEKVIEFMKDKVMPRFNGAEIIYHENCSPSYEMVAPLDKNADFANEPGWYDLFSEGDELGAEYDALLEECEKAADAEEIFWSRPIHKSVYIYEDKKDEIIFG
jgi:hypothetical protein